uniref:IF rod domain-containing protein n=1 Tax=Erpetoichthys calabaricus TaxID=27687 RepID=A0A8C4TBQ3_ERPCA
SCFGGGAGGFAGGGAGGLGVSSGGFFSSSSISGVPFMLNEKQQMQSLNDRLATYLDKVRTLEATNKDLENKLKDFRTSKVPLFKAIQWQYHFALLRYEAECIIRQTVAADILNLKSLKEEYDSHQTSNNQEVEALKKEIEEMTKHILKEEMSGTVSVDVTTTESPDLKQILDDLRAEYEDIVRRNKEDLEMWFNKQVIGGQVLTILVYVLGWLLHLAIQETDVSETFADVTGPFQDTELHLFIILFSVQKGTLEDNLAAVNGCYQMELHRYAAGGTMEGEHLLNIKEKLEKEIATYKLLLEGVELGAAHLSSPTSFNGLCMFLALSSRLSSEQKRQHCCWVKLDRSWEEHLVT